MPSRNSAATERLAFRIVVMAVLGAAVIFGATTWLEPAKRAVNGPQTSFATYPSPTSIQSASTRQEVAAPNMADDVVRMLAEGGCPGWMALAAEPELVDGTDGESGPIASRNSKVPPTRQLPSDIRETSSRRQAKPPTVRYPVPIRVAQRPDVPNDRPVAIAFPTPRVARAEDPDALVSEEEDLIGPLFDALNDSSDQLQGSPGRPIQQRRPQAEAALPNAPANQPLFEQPPAPPSVERTSDELPPTDGPTRLPGVASEPPINSQPSTASQQQEGGVDQPTAGLEEDSTDALIAPEEDLVGDIDDLSHGAADQPIATPTDDADGSVAPQTGADVGSPDPQPIPDPPASLEPLFAPPQSTDPTPPQVTPQPNNVDARQVVPPPPAPDSATTAQPPSNLPQQQPDQPKQTPPEKEQLFAPPGSDDEKEPDDNDDSNDDRGKPSDKQDDKAAKDKEENQSKCTFDPETLYPSAETCRTCHEKIYDEWSMSSHAYAMVSPMFHRFEKKINDLTRGTLGYFCYRCHSPAGTSLGISRITPLWDLPQVAREGVTCVSCHRIIEAYGKTNGERWIVPGDIYDPVYGSIGGAGVAEAAAKKDHFKVKTSPHEKGPGQPMHAAAFYSPQLARPEFCTSCHQVAVHPGIKLEVVWEQYRASPACKKGVSCQDCHMGRIPGIPSGYETGPAAVINKKSVTENRKHANHVFYGPGYSIAHPGIFPFNPKANRWQVNEWLLFDWRAGWGTDEFEDAVDEGRIKVEFPKVWEEVDDRYDARELIDDNLKKKAKKDHLRAMVMENGSHVDGPFFDGAPCRGQELRFHYVVANINEGHNLPTASLGAQPQLWANVVLIGPRGQRLWETGYLDRFGDLADIHSEDVRNKRIAYDWQLFNLQTMFLITGVKGADREFFLPVNIDIDQLPFIRPGAQPISVINHPPFIRMEARSLAPLGSRKVNYKIPAELLVEPGHYRLSFRMRSRLEPPYFMRFCDSTPEMVRAMNEGILNFHQSSIEFEIR